MVRRYLRWGGVVLLGALLFATAWWSGRSYFGFCHAESRYLSDAEKVDIGIEAALSGYPPPLAKFDIHPPKDPIYYANKEEFLRINPNCCALTDSIREGQAVTFWSRLKGTNSTYVTVNYLVRYRDESGNTVAEPASTARAISNCGHAWPGY